MVPPVLRIRLPSAAAAVLLLFAAGCGPMPAATAPGGEAGRYLVYFNEFSAYLSDDARNVVAEAARYSRENGARAIRIEGRASATGAPVANQRLAETRTEVVYDELQKDGINPAILQQQPIGQTGSPDVSVENRRVDIVLLK